jgi:putative membrane protein
VGALIERYTDHAANERTYLAWVRTALAVMAFGLLVERFDLLLRSLPQPADTAAGDGLAGTSRTVGLVLVLLGVVVLAASTHRYLRSKRLISSAETRDFAASRTDLVLVAIVALLGAGMSIYVVAQVVR